MAIVVDTSAVIAVAGNEPIKPRLIELTRGHELFAPPTLSWEIGNAASAMFKRRRITLADAKTLIRQFRMIPIQIAEVDLDDAIELASALNIYAYDAYLIQCARETGFPVLTIDGGLRDAGRRAGVAIVEVQP